MLRIEDNHTRVFGSNCSAHGAARTGIMIHNEVWASPRVRHLDYRTCHNGATRAPAPRRTAIGQRRADRARALGVGGR